jgi:hypothetical protein
MSFLNRIVRLPSFNKNFFRNLTRDILGGVERELWSRIDPAEDINTPRISVNDFRPGDVNIENITLVSADGNRVHDLMQYVKEIHIYESIIHPSMFCEMSMADSISLYETFPITTNEFITFSVQTPGREKNEYRFAINRVGDKVTMPGNKMVTYKLQLVSPELKASSASPIVKQFKGTISDMIKDILTEDIGTKKNINIEPSTGIIDKTTGVRFPFALIHEHYLDADNRRDNHGVYVFFENKRGYNLVTYEKLIKDGKKELRFGSDKRFEFTPIRNANSEDIKFRNILAYNQSMFCDAIDIVSLGGMNSTAIHYDPATGFGDRARYRESQDGGNLPTTDNNGTALIGTDFIRQYERNSIVNMLVAVNSETRPNTNLAEVLVKRNAFLNKLKQIEAQIFVYGDSNLAVGDVIECSFPTSSSAENDKGETRLDSGNYLITHLRHMILFTDRPQHVIACNLMKAGMLGIN